MNGLDEREPVGRPALSADGQPTVFSLAAQWPGSALTRGVGRWLDRQLGLEGVNWVYRTGLAQGDERPFVDKLLEAIEITYDVAESDLDRIPDQGPVLVVSNHPFGGIEGLLLLSLFKSVRPDTRLLVNYLLGRVPELAPDFFFVNPFGGAAAARQSIRGVREALNWVRSGGLLVTFPAGEVAHLNGRRMRIEESPWLASTAGIVRRTQCAVLPVYCAGRNSGLFHLAGLLHPRLRTALLAREIMNKCGQALPIHLGRPIPYRRLEGLDDAALLAYLRHRTFNLAQRDRRALRVFVRLPWPLRRRPPREEAIRPATPVADLARAVADLPPEARLLTSGEYDVFVAPGERIPTILTEIGRLREITFRAVGEGTGLPCDLDEYDTYYQHIFVWQRVKQELVAAYRLGLSDEILAQWGRKGLYTNSLFRYRRKLLEHLNPALEMGRSFVRSEYQRSYNPLLLLWRGIGQFLVNNPRYRYLFGPVSITDNYRTRSREMLMAFLKLNRYEDELARLVKPRTPPRSLHLKWLLRRGMRGAVVDNIEEIENLIGDIETELQGIPILLKQYLKLGGRLLGFNLDPEFNYCLDGLIYVDVLATDPKVLLRYLGREGVAKYFAYHNHLPPPLPEDATEPKPTPPPQMSTP
ncbi:MAG: lysophospholipid acyltransferase family protein [Candidatus Marinimicrobia bacterium]|nr:lysophospholipid acyltransferase family protein [Candidatus Neomarinimicrobiota bacterium]